MLKKTLIALLIATAITPIAFAQPVNQDPNQVKAQAKDIPALNPFIGSWKGECDLGQGGPITIDITKRPYDLVVVMNGVLTGKYILNYSVGEVVSGGNTYNTTTTFATLDSKNNAVKLQSSSTVGSGGFIIFLKTATLTVEGDQLKLDGENQNMVGENQGVGSSQGMQQRCVLNKIVK